MDGRYGVSPAPRKRGPIDYRRAGVLWSSGGPGLGIELNDTALARLRLREIVTEPPIERDGSVQDW